MNISDEKKVYEILNRTLKSKTFQKTTTSSVLLKLLVEATLKEQDLSAFKIGLELFGEDSDKDKIEVKTRVNIHHLRKKLQRYYETEGLDDKVQFYIKPGQYEVSFISNSASERYIKNRKRWILGSCVFLIISIALIFHLNKKDTIWTPLLNNGHTTTLFLGDVFGYSGETAFSDKGWLRDFNINSIDDFYKEARKNPQKHEDYTPADFGYIVFENSTIIKNFSEFFYKKKHDFSLRKASDFNIKQIVEQNTIYTGPLFSGNTFISLFNEFSKNIKLETKNTSWKQYFLHYQKISEAIDTTIRIRGNINFEYTVAAKFLGSNNTSHYMILSNHGLGLQAVADYLTDEESLQEFSNEYLHDSDEFISVFSVTGKDRTSFDIELILFDDNK